MRLAALLLSLTLAPPALADALRVIDGDTFAIGRTRYRIASIDTPELRARCEQESDWALAAKYRLGELLRGRVEIAPLGLDRYGRILADVYANGEDVGARMVAEGMARPWRGRREGWC